MTAPAAGSLTGTRRLRCGPQKGTNVDSMTTNFGQVLLWTFWFFIWIAALMVWFRSVFDVLRDHSLSGWGKPGWVVLLILAPWLGALIYIIARRPQHERAPNERVRRGPRPAR